MNRAWIFSFGILTSLALLGSPTTKVVAAEATAEPTSPLSAEQSLQYFELPDGLKIEVAAQEPNVIDPVAIRFDERGRMWVVEMRDYPTVETRGNVARSRISLLSDEDGDGFFETATIFADNLPYATGVQPWKGGVFVTMAGQVAYMKDTDGDGQADRVETWYKGFSEENTQLRANHPQLALDNHIYIANGLRGGTVVDAQRADAKPVSISGMDFRFDPLTRQYEAVTGAGQFGLTFDDYGNRFVCSNRNPAMHIVLEDSYLKQNPLATVSTVLHDVAAAGADSRVYPITRSWTTSHTHAGQFTAACGVLVYRGTALPEEYHGNLFVCEPTNHLVHREIMRPDGITFSSQPAREGIDFLASRDPWWSPVNMEVGPDGALYVVDMYRAVIEHPEWMPTELKDRPDQMYGKDRGRIYRITAKNAGRLAALDLGSKSDAALLELLAHPNSWQRETAARLLLERQHKNIGPELEKMALQHESQLARIHALRLLDGLKLPHDELLLQLLDDPDSRIVEQAILVSQSRVGDSPQLCASIARLVKHSDPRVRFLALVTASPLPPPPRYPTDRWELDAVLIATGDRGGTVLAEWLEHPKRLVANLPQPAEHITELARLAVASEDAEQQTIALQSLLASDVYCSAGLIGFFVEASRRNILLDAIRSQLDPTTRQQLDTVLEKARINATNKNTPIAVRLKAIELVSHTDDSADILLPLILNDVDQAVRLRAIAGLNHQKVLKAWQQLLEHFSLETPAIQQAILDGLMTQPQRTSLLLDEIAAGRIKATEVNAAHATHLVNHSDPAIQSRAKALLAAALPADRQQALSDYQSVLKLAANSANGKLVFTKHCAPCHRIGEVGVQFAPDISDSREKTIEQLLTDILQPNRAIDSNYFSYTALTNDGFAHTGVLSAETSTSVTLKQAEGKSITLSRQDIDQLHSNGISLMPDGFEKNISPQEMADLIGFIKNWRYLDGELESAALK